MKGVVEYGQPDARGWQLVTRYGSGMILGRIRKHTKERGWMAQSFISELLYVGMKRKDDAAAVLIMDAQEGAA